MRDFVYAPPRGKVTILHEAPDFLILDKPSGLLSVPGKAENHQDCVEARVREDFPEARTVHRLDMATSGLMVMARNAPAHRHLGLQFERRHTHKTYLAHIWGCPKDKSGEINLPLICDWPNRPLQKVDHEVGKPSLTNWEIIETFQDYSIVKLTPKTGRSHQLRVHMNELGHPILGDRLYAHDKAFAAAPRLCLHAHTLEFHNPTGGERTCFTAPCPF